MTNLTYVSVALITQKLPIQLNQLILIALKYPLDLNRKNAHQNYLSHSTHNKETSANENEEAVISIMFAWCCLI